MIRPVLLPVLDHEKIRTREASETRPNQLTFDDSPGAAAGAAAVSVVETADSTNRGLLRTSMIRLVLVLVLVLVLSAVETASFQLPLASLSFHCPAWWWWYWWHQYQYWYLLVATTYWWHQHQWWYWCWYHHQ